MRDDAIMATGRSDYPNQVNNVLGFPFIFRGALDVRAVDHQHGNEDRRRACARRAWRARTCPTKSRPPMAARPKFGPEYIIPAPFDPRLISRMCRRRWRRPRWIPASRASRSSTWTPTSISCNARRDPIAGTLVQVYAKLRRSPKRVVFAEGEEEQVIRAAASFVAQGLGTALLVGREERVQAKPPRKPASSSARASRSSMRALSKRNTVYLNYLYERLQRHGYLLRDCQRLVNTDRNYFASCMVALGDADAMVTGVTRNFSVALEDVRRVIDPKPGHRVIGVSLVVARGRTVVVADTAVTEMPNGRGPGRYRRRSGRRGAAARL